ncbi:MAG: hypothetical protein JNK18_04765 [Cyclobacteriaceae bacterium]|nr:hypothetical protein [Cyclobacteriaceae bacterium]
MKHLIAVLLSITLSACSRPQLNESQTNTEAAGVTSAPSSLNGDTLAYFGYINKFPDNNFFFTDLYFVDSFNYDSYNEITKLGTQVVYRDDEMKRTRIEIAAAEPYFDLRGLKTIALYDEANERLTTGQLSHIEYVEDLIESSFVAVFQVENPNIVGPVFCIGNSPLEPKEIQCLAWDDQTLTATLIKHLELNAGDVSVSSHYKIEQQIISTISSDTTAFITENQDNLIEVLYKSKSREVIKRITPVAINVRGKRLYLAECGLPDTDLSWNSVLAFNGTTYDIVRESRVGHKLLGR